MFRLLEAGFDAVIAAGNRERRASKHGSVRPISSWPPAASPAEDITAVIIPGEGYGKVGMDPGGQSVFIGCTSTGSFSICLASLGADLGLRLTCFVLMKDDLIVTAGASTRKGRWGVPMAT